jgi:hypothetical protein
MKPQLWKACNSMGTHFFVITSYGQWAFGVFSSGAFAADGGVTEEKMLAD